MGAGASVVDFGRWSASPSTSNGAASDPLAAGRDAVVATAYEERTHLARPEVEWDSDGRPRFIGRRVPAFRVAVYAPDGTPLGLGELMDDGCGRWHVLGDGEEHSQMPGSSIDIERMLELLTRWRRQR